MDPVDLEVLRRARDWVRSGQSTWLATVVATWGSSPRPAGSMLSCNAAGEIVGSLSGGCVEDDLIDKLVAGQLATHAPVIHRYGVTPEDTERLGLPCGGHLDIVVEPLGAGVADQFAHIVERLEQRRCVRRTLAIPSGAAEIHDTNDFESLEFSGAPGNEGLLTQSFGPRLQLFLTGCGMVSQYVASIGLMLGYQVRVCEPREHLVAQWPHADIPVVTTLPDDAVRRYASDQRSAIVALTHDPRVDDMALMEALCTDAFYVGAMGSTRTSAARRERLLMLDLSAEQIDRLHAPAGFPIGSKTPPEIAVAVLAEITAVRHHAAARARADVVAISA